MSAQHEIPQAVHREPLEDDIRLRFNPQDQVKTGADQSDVVIAYKKSQVPDSFLNAPPSSGIIEVIIDDTSGRLSEAEKRAKRIEDIMSRVQLEGNVPPSPAPDVSVSVNNKQSADDKPPLKKNLPKAVAGPLARVGLALSTLLASVQGGTALAHEGLPKAAVATGQESGNEQLFSVETTANYTIDMNKVAFAGNRLIFMSKVNGNPEEHLVIMDIDFLDPPSSLGKDIGKLPLNVNSVSVLGDKLAAGGTQLNDSTKGLVWYSLHGGKNPIISPLRILSETGQTVAGPVQRVSIPIPPPGQWYLQNNVIFESSDPTDSRNIPISAGVLDTNTGIVTSLSGSPASYAESNMLATSSTTAVAAGINRQNLYIQAGYTSFNLDTTTNTITSTVNTEGTNNAWLDGEIIKYFRESDNKLITLTFDPFKGIMNYNIEDKLTYAIDPAKGYSLAAAEGKNLYILTADTVPDPIESYLRLYLIQIDPANGYDNVTKQKVIPLADAGLPKGIREAAVYIVRYQNGEVPVIATNKGVWLINETGNLMQVLVQKQPKNRINIPIVMKNALRTIPGW